MERFDGRNSLGYVLHLSFSMVVESWCEAVQRIWRMIVKRLFGLMDWLCPVVEIEGN